MARLTSLPPRVAMAGGRELSRVDANSWRSGKTTAERGYDGRWQRESKRYLAKNPLCVICLAVTGNPVAATVVDHKIPHRGDRKIFWDMGNWQALCASCHSSHAQRRDNRLGGHEGWGGS